MPEPRNIVFEHRELAEILVRELELDEGLWGLYIEFGIQGANVSSDPAGEALIPAAIVPVLKIGVQKFDKPNLLTVDAAALTKKKKTPSGSKSKKS